MLTRLNRALQIRTADRLRATLARDEVSGLPAIRALSDDDQRELCEAGGGRLGMVVIHVAWVQDGALYPLSIHAHRSRVMAELARLVDAQVRRTDLLGSLSEDALLILAPAIDPASGQRLVERLRRVVARRNVEPGGARVTVGFASRSSASLAGWTIQTLAEEAERNAADVPPMASVA